MRSPDTILTLPITTRLIDMVTSHEAVVGLAVIGSGCTPHSDEFSDLDLICVLRDDDGSPIADILHRIHSLHNDAIQCTLGSRFYSWIGHVTTIYLRQPWLAGIDLSRIALDDLPNYYIQPEALLLYDPTGAIERRKVECYGRSWHPVPTHQDLIDEVLRNSVKVLRYYRRGQLWASIHYVSLLRRSAISLVRSINSQPGYSTLPERRLEQEIDLSTHSWLSDSLPRYDPQSILLAARHIIDFIVSCTPYNDSAAFETIVMISKHIDSLASPRLIEE